MASWREVVDQTSDFRIQPSSFWGNSHHSSYNKVTQERSDIRPFAPMVSATASGEHGELNVADTPPADRTLPPLPDTFPPLPPQTASELLSLADQRHPSNWLEDTLSPDSYFDPPSTFLDGFDRDIYDRGNNFVNIFPMAPSTKKPAQLSATPIKPQSTSKPTARSSNDAQAIVEGVWSNYVNRTPQRVKLLDTFMAFLIVVGVLQFVYCVIAGNYVRFMGMNPCCW